jgi:hypothetical protein
MTTLSICLVDDGFLIRAVGNKIRARFGRDLGEMRHKLGVGCDDLVFDFSCDFGILNGGVQVIFVFA